MHDGAFQPMPELSANELETLRADIAENGIQVPVIKDQHGRIIDGNHRAAIADDLGIDYPTQVIEVADDGDAWNRAVALNCARRHLTREQVRDIIASEIGRCPDDSDRAIARRVGCSPSTVGAVRSGLRQAVDEIVAEVRIFQRGLCARVIGAHLGGADLQSSADVVERQTWAELSKLDSWLADKEVFGTVLGPVFDALRAHDCPADCEVCTPAWRNWRDKCPSSVYRWTAPPEVSKLDTSLGATAATVRVPAHVNEHT
jgi:ParB-like chromosome segregation protein Spo0J